MSGPDEPEPSDLDGETLWRLYARAVDEYRFQVNSTGNGCGVVYAVVN